MSNAAGPGMDQDLFARPNIGAIDQGFPLNGEWRIKFGANKPRLESAVQCWRAEKAPFAELEIAHSGQTATARIYWKRLDDDKYDARKSLDLAVDADFVSRGYTIPWAAKQLGAKTLLVEKDKAGEDTLLELVTEAGADDMKDDGSNWEILSAPENFHNVVEKLKAAQITPAAAEVSMVPQNYVKLTGKQAEQMLRLMEELEDHEDVQHVYANFDIEEAELHALTQEK